ncbi:MAG: methenyltetrahydromethanopterin cyclohydrolase [Promethearchaeati archaeon SRVP18_Atabeyarchaeia-1]
MAENDVSVNSSALPIVQEMIEYADELRIKVTRTENGATVLDAGIEAKGSFNAGRFVTEVCLGGLGTASLSMIDYGGGLILPSIFVETGYPAIATLGSQFAGWRIKDKEKKIFGMGSGPARALSLEPKEIYEKISYEDKAKQAVIVIETDHTVDNDIVETIAGKCLVSYSDLYVIVAPTSSVVGSVQISGRVVETGIHKLSEVGFDPKKIRHACGVAPIAPIHPNSAKAMGRTNDVILAAGRVYLTVEAEEEDLSDIINKVPSSSSKDYGRPFHQTFKAAGYDFYKIDPGLFAPAEITINDLKTGKLYHAGRVDVELLKKSFE